MMSNSRCPQCELFQRVTHANMDSSRHTSASKIAARLIRVFGIAVGIEDFPALSHRPGKPKRGISNS